MINKFHRILANLNFFLVTIEELHGIIACQTYVVRHTGRSSKFVAVYAHAFLQII